MSDKPHIEPGTMIWVRDDYQSNGAWCLRKFVSYSGYTGVLCEGEPSPNFHFHWDQFSLTDPTEEGQSTPIPEFKPGDRVICIDSSDSLKRLDEGRQYIVTRVRGNEYLDLQDNCGRFYHKWSVKRFRLVEEPTPIPDYSDTETMDDIKPSPGQEAITREGQALLDLLLRKNRDYGNSAMTPPILAPTMTPREAIQCRMSDKVRRLERLLGGNQATVNESIEDTIRDLGGYCILWLAAED